MDCTILRHLKSRKGASLAASLSLRDAGCKGVGGKTAATRQGRRVTGRATTRIDEWTKPFLRRPDLDEELKAAFEVLLQCWGKARDGVAEIAAIQGTIGRGWIRCGRQRCGYYPAGAKAEDERVNTSPKGVPCPSRPHDLFERGGSRRSLQRRRWPPFLESKRFHTALFRH